MDTKRFMEVSSHQPELGIGKIQSDIVNTHTYGWEEWWLRFFFLHKIENETRGKGGKINFTSVWTSSIVDSQKIYKKNL